jgi:hypothetical protein
MTISLKSFRPTLSVMWTIVCIATQLVLECCSGLMAWELIGACCSSMTTTSVGPAIYGGFALAVGAAAAAAMVATRTTALIAIVVTTATSLMKRRVVRRWEVWLVLLLCLWWEVWLVLNLSLEERHCLLHLGNLRSQLLLCLVGLCSGIVHLLHERY